MNPFEFVNAINYTKKNIMIDDITEKAYAPYMVIRQLSYHLTAALIVLLKRK